MGSEPTFTNMLFRSVGAPRRRHYLRGFTALGALLLLASTLALWSPSTIHIYNNGYNNGPLRQTGDGRTPLVAPPEPAIVEQPRAVNWEDAGFVQVTVARSVAEAFWGDPSVVARQARIVPSVANGRANGFKLFAIRPNSLYALLGLQNGDTVHRINGLVLSNPDKALRVYSRLRQPLADEYANFVVDLTRRGEAMLLVITLVNDAKARS